MARDSDDELRNNAEYLWSHRLGSSVRSRRRSLGLSQHDVALLAGVGVRLMHEIEHGKPSARLDKVVAVLTVLGLQLTVVNGVDGVAVSGDG